MKCWVSEVNTKEDLFGTCQIKYMVGYIVISSIFLAYRSSSYHANL